MSSANPLESSNAKFAFRAHNERESSCPRQLSKRSEFLAGATGLGPEASCVTGRRSNQLKYAPQIDGLLKPPRTTSYFQDLQARGEPKPPKS